MNKVIDPAVLEERRIKLNQWQREYRQKNRDKINARDRMYYRTNEKRRKANQENSKKWRERNKDLRPLNRRYIAYGISPEEQLKLYELQNKKCAICKKDIDLRGKGTHIDHDHKTGIVRGLVCNPCNVGLGMFYDNSELLLNAFKYLSLHDA